MSTSIPNSYSLCRISQIAVSQGFGEVGVGVGGVLVGVGFSQYGFFGSSTRQSYAISAHEG